MILVLVTIVHVVVCLFLIAVVLLQSGASADLAGAFGGLGSQTAFGPRAGANLLTKLTTWAAILFMLTSFTLAIISSRHGSSSGSVLDNTKSAPTQNAPAK
jgi:preprotein translocase subunit SecG